MLSRTRPERSIGGNGGGPAKRAAPPGSFRDAIQRRSESFGGAGLASPPRIAEPKLALLRRDSAFSSPGRYRAGLAFERAAAAALEVADEAKPESGSCVWFGFLGDGPCPP